jgi:hypothetical protein
MKENKIFEFIINHIPFSEWSISHEWEMYYCQIKDVEFNILSTNDLLVNNITICISSTNNTQLSKKWESYIHDLISYFDS